MTLKKAEALSNHEIVTLAVYLLGGDSKRIDTEDVAVKANELAPERFAWRKYPNQINIENVRTFLSDAKKLKNEAYLIGPAKMVGYGLRGTEVSPGQAESVAVQLRKTRAITDAPVMGMNAGGKVGPQV
jgi:hypothetical protein